MYRIIPESEPLPPAMAFFFSRLLAAILAIGWFGGAAAADVNHAAAVPPRAAPDLLGTLAGDINSAAVLVQRQLAQPLRGESGIATCLGLLLAGLALAWPLRLWLIGRAVALLVRWDREGRCHAEAAAMITVVGTTLLVGMGAHLLRLAVDAGFVLLPQTAALADTVGAGLAIVGLGMGIGNALRPLPTADRTPLHLSGQLGPGIAFYPIAGAALLGLSGFVERASAILHAAPVSGSVAHGLVMTLEAALIVAFLIAVGRARDTGTAPASSPRSLTLTALGWAAVALGLLALVFGYTHFAALLFQEMIWASMVGFTALLLVNLVDALLDWLFGTNNAAGHFATHIIGLRRAQIDQVRILAIGLATAVIWLLAIGLILAPLGGAGASLVDQVQPRLLVGELRNLHIAPRAIATAALILVVGVVITRLLRHWLQNRFLPATALDVGVRTSIVTGLSYAGILLALLAATNALGIALDKITLIASALSVGIGFGLQSIIQNFVSGVILLIERPIKVGDWVSASGAEGSVRRINVRATEIAMPDGSITIVPNSSFISANVQNRAAAGIAGRIDLAIKVSGTSSPAQARDAILESVRAIELIRREPPPKLLLTDASQDGCGFVLQAYAVENRSTAETKSELLYVLADRLNAAGLKTALS